jgi:hypothetical protein
MMKECYGSRSWEKAARRNALVNCSCGVSLFPNMRLGTAGLEFVGCKFECYKINFFFKLSRFHTTQKCFMNKNFITQN